ncbi:MAG: hypothetical protein M0Q92_04425 [Methanoregula sp.]|nr:hypothetical protein [Methanoregula sp.]
MQLPRGTFREIKKGETIEDLLSELERSRFSGLCSISSGEGSGTLVFKGGKCILVKYLGKCGDGGCTELQKNRTAEVDAALSSLDDAQIQLALEFNKTCRLVKVTKPLDDPVKAVQSPHEPVKKATPPVHAAAAKTAPQKSPVASLFHRPASPPQPTAASPEPKIQRAAPAPPRPAMPSLTKAQQPPSPQTEVPDHIVTEENSDNQVQPSSFDNDIDSFDNMDLDNVTDKIRNDCKTMIKQLHLEHLMER